MEEHALPDRVLKWVVQCVDPMAVIESVRLLDGSTSSSVYGLSIRLSNAPLQFVLRQFDNVEWRSEEPDLARHEAGSLRRAATIDVPTPTLVAFDETGEDCGVPSVLMTRLEGAVVLRPRDMNIWVDRLAQSLAQIHAVGADDYPWAYFTYADIPSLKTPTWSSVPELWDEALRMVSGPQPVSRECFIHRDYHPANVLWTEHPVSGVVDWVNACRGPAGIDVGHCRVNLAQLFNVPTANAFLTAYRRYAGAVFDYDPFWDLLSLIEFLSERPTVYPGWKAFGVHDVTEQLIRERLDAFVTSVAGRISGD
ncbi:phosphotransferase family protein [Alicyclobacillus dauci]|uniref:Aminoglycoside phosphotransferase family protein n=1 Tax=Alicyclobacillus dauci TaxID=1475485 RepID=A0ABY6Z9H2_9BACL|nr:aminoglycoside phosphotransferase family protein [Alicyclobacillus dauci]WAH38735.1 aminoglycoside phosphotransferase family protein [Alicyclobacillus dauci]